MGHSSPAPATSATTPPPPATATCSTAAARPHLPRATIWFGAGDWRYFIEERHGPPIQDHAHQGFRGHAGHARLRPIDRDTTVAPGVTAVQAPGHTPGHLCVVVASDAHRAILLGDAVTCPVQLDEPTWHSIGDVDSDLANRTREHLWRELEGENVTGAGAHFPELKFGRVLEAKGQALVDVTAPSGPARPPVPPPG